MIEADGSAERPYQAENTKILFLPMAGQLKVGRLTVTLAGIEVDMIEAGLANDQKSLGAIITEMKRDYPGFYCAPSEVTREHVVEAVEMVMKRHPEVVKDPLPTLHGRLLSKHPIELSGKNPASGEVIIAFEFVITGEERGDVGPVARLMALNLFRKLPVGIQAGIRYRGHESGSEASRYLVQRPS